MGSIVSAPPPGMGWEGLRALFSVLEDAHFALAGRAAAEMAAVLYGRWIGLAVPPKALPAGYSNTKELGRILYTDYVYAFEIAAVVLLVAIIAAISGT